MSEHENIIIATSKIPGAMKELARLLQYEFNLTEEEVIVETGHSDRILLISDKAFSRIILPQIKAYCKGFEDALDVSDYLPTEFLNDR